MEIGSGIYVKRSIISSLATSSALSTMQNHGVGILTYNHYGVYTGNDEVIHFAGSTIETAKIIKTSLEEFSKTPLLGFLTGGNNAVLECFKLDYKFSRIEIVSRAKSKLGENFGGYDLLRNNCEHFTSWCTSNKKASNQIFFLNDDKDIVEKGIDRVFAPILSVSQKIDDFFGW